MRTVCLRSFYIFEFRHRLTGKSREETQLFAQRLKGILQYIGVLLNYFRVLVNVICLALRLSPQAPGGIGRQ